MPILQAMELKNEHKAFCRELVKHQFNQTAAYKAVYGSELSDEVAKANASRLLSNANVKEYLDNILNKYFDDLDVDARDVAKKLWETVTADPNELVEIRRDCCRYCYGINHLYQYTPAEWDAVWHRHQQDVFSAELMGKRPPAEPPIRGGIGFNRRMPPYPGCPECHGEGVEDVFIKDTRNLSSAAKQLYAGVKATRNGIEIKFNSRDKSIELMGRYLSMFSDTVNLQNNGGSFEPMSIDKFYATFQQQPGNDDDEPTES